MKAKFTFTFLFLFLLIILSCRKEKKHSPACDIVKPETESTFQRNEIIEIDVVATDEDGVIEEVRFYIDEEFVSSIGIPPYKYQWNTNEISPGIHSVKAIALDNDNLESESSISIIIEIKEATVITGDHKDITHNSVVCRGEVIDSGGSEVTERGICWSSEQNPVVDDNKITTGIGVGLFEVTIQNLNQNTEYYYRAYAVNEKGISYGENKSFKTKELTGNPDIEYILVEGGTFQMGNNDGRENEKPVHNVTLSTYQMSKYEVTIIQYIEFLNAIKCHRDGYFIDPEFNYAQYIHMSSYYCAIDFKDGQFVFKGSIYAETPNCPVAEVTWYGANAYCRWAGGHLPTEAQWDYAARGGKYSQGYIFSGSNDISEVAWYKRTYTNKTNPVGQKQPNELGIYDMTGNVSEWCADRYDSYSSDDQINPTGGTSGKYRIYRGGSYVSDADESYIAYRGFTDMYVCDWITGFRIARN